MKLKSYIVFFFQMAKQEFDSWFRELVFKGLIHPDHAFYSDEA
jgi:hypothetical protein